MAKQRLSAIARVKAGIRGLYYGFTKGLHGDSGKTLSSLLGAPAHTGHNVNPMTSMQITAVWGCVRIISETMASLPLQMLKRLPDGSAEPADHPLADVLNASPNSEQTGVEYREGLGVGLCLRGNAYSEVIRTGTGRIVALMPLPDDTYAFRDKQTNAIAYKFYDRGKEETLPNAKVWHVRGFGGTPLAGLSPIGHARQALGLALATEEYGARYFSQGARPASIVEIPEWLTAEQREEAYKRLDRMYAGLDNAHKVFILEGGMQHKTVSMSPEDSQFIASRHFQIQEICRIFRVPLHFVMEMEGSTNNNIEYQGQSLATHTLLPYFRRIEQSIEKWLLTPEERVKYFFRHNFEGLLRGDTAARGAFYAQMLQNGVYSRNEVRALENRPSVDGLDDYTIQLNMAPVGTKKP